MDAAEAADGPSRRPPETPRNRGYFSRSEKPDGRGETFWFLLGRLPKGTRPRGRNKKPARTPKRRGNTEAEATMPARRRERAERWVSLRSTPSYVVLSCSTLSSGQLRNGTQTTPCHFNTDNVVVPLRTSRLGSLTSVRCWSRNVGITCCDNHCRTLRFSGWKK